MDGHSISDLDPKAYFNLHPKAELEFQFVVRVQMESTGLTEHQWLQAAKCHVMRQIEQQIQDAILAQPAEQNIRLTASVSAAKREKGGIFKKLKAKFSRAEINNSRLWIPYEHSSARLYRQVQSRRDALDLEIEFEGNNNAS